MIAVVDLMKRKVLGYREKVHERRKRERRSWKNGQRSKRGKSRETTSEEILRLAWSSLEGRAALVVYDDTLFVVLCIPSVATRLVVFRKNGTKPESFIHLGCLRDFARILTTNVVSLSTIRVSDSSQETIKKSSSLWSLIK